MKIESYNLDRIPMEIKAVTTYPKYWSDRDLSALYRSTQYADKIDIRGNCDSGVHHEVWLICWPDGIEHLSDVLRDLEKIESQLAGYCPEEKPGEDDRAHTYQVIQNFNSTRAGIS